MPDFEIKDSILIKYTGEEKEVTIPNTVTGIGYEAFDGCDNLENIIIVSSNGTENKIDVRNCKKEILDEYIATILKSIKNKTSKI